MSGIQCLIRTVFFTNMLEISRTERRLHTSKGKNCCFEKLSLMTYLEIIEIGDED